MSHPPLTKVLDLPCYYFLPITVQIYDVSDSNQPAVAGIGAPRNTWGRRSETAAWMRRYAGPSRRTSLSLMQNSDKVVAFALHLPAEELAVFGNQF